MPPRDRVRGRKHILRSLAANKRHPASGSQFRSFATEEASFYLIGSPQRNCSIEQMWYERPSMRSADDFDQFYSAPDPWRISQAKGRDRLLRRLLLPHVQNRTVLELGCGEGHLTSTIFRHGRRVHSIDISQVAIRRAQALNVPNATFEASDFLSAHMRGFDIIAAIECVYYLTLEEQDRFFAKVAAEHAGKTLLLSGPIVGETQYRRYFTHAELLAKFDEHRIELVGYRNLNIYRKATRVPRLMGNGAALLAKLPVLGDRLVDVMPETLIYQRLYVLQMPLT